jgi:hypothetical protein
MYVSCSANALQVHAVQDVLDAFALFADAVFRWDLHLGKPVDATKAQAKV